MKVGNITESQDVFSYKDERFSPQKFIICVRDDRYESHAKPIIAINNRELIDLDDYEFKNNILAARPGYNNNREDLPLNRFHINQLIKIDYDFIVENRAEGPNIKTYNANFSQFDSNQIIEFYEGKLNEEEALFTPTSNLVFDLIRNVYIERENSFFIIIDKKFIGPFKVLKVNGDSFNIAKSSSSLKFGEYRVEEHSYIEFEANDILRKVYLPEVSKLRLDFIKESDFISDDELFSEFENELINNPDFFNESKIKEVLAFIKKATKEDKITTKEKHKNRLIKIFDKGERVLNQDIDLLRSIPEIKGFEEEKEKLDEYISTRKNELREIKEQIRNSSDERDNISDEILQLKDKIEDLEATKTAELENQKSDLDNEIKELENRKNNLKETVAKEKNELEGRLSSLKGDVDYFERNKNELKITIDNLRNDFREEQKNAQISLQNLIKSKIHFDFISGRDLSPQETEEVSFKDFRISDEFEKNQYRDFRNEILSVLKQNNRDFETHFIDNLLISVFQNTLTVFAGIPGTGKTTLARLLTNILAPKEKIREVSVNRGWSSQKDFIGFVNPLSKKFHSSSTDIYSLLKQIDNEAKDEDKYLNSPMSFVVLDEANLSPLEHYWSSFYNLTDSSGMLEVKLGHNESTKFPNNLRFIGTINYDHTTEELSPRVLDRINIIQLKRFSEINLTSINNKDIKRIKLSFKRCKDFFELDDNSGLDIKDEMISNNFKDIKNEFKKLKIFISPRVEIGIKRYIKLANKYMSDVNKPLDYCVAQRLLPLINIYGDENKPKLEALKEYLKNSKCEISTKILDNIIRIGSEKGIYENNFNYFLTLSNV